MATHENRSWTTAMSDGMGDRARMKSRCLAAVGVRSGFACEDLVFFHQFLFRLDMIGIMRNTVDRAHLYTLGCLVVTDTFCAQVRIDHIDFITSTDRLVRALWFTYITIDAFVSYDQCHLLALHYKGSLPETSNISRLLYPKTGRFVLTQSKTLGVSLP